MTNAFIRIWRFLAIRVIEIPHWVFAIGAMRGGLLPRRLNARPMRQNSFQLSAQKCQLFETKSKERKRTRHPIESSDTRRIPSVTKKRVASAENSARKT